MARLIRACLNRFFTRADFYGEPMWYVGPWNIQVRHYPNRRIGWARNVFESGLSELYIGHLGIMYATAALQKTDGPPDENGTRWFHYGLPNTATITEDERE
jgi:hypothetical protein